MTSRRVKMDELINGFTLHSSPDGASFKAITEIDICKRCGKRTIMCPHKIPKEKIIKLPAETSHVKVVLVEPDMRITISSERNIRMAKLVENVKFSLLETVTTLEEVWDDIGIKDDQKDQRNNTVLDHLQDLLNEMLAEESDLKAKMQLKTEEYRRELDQLCVDLQFPMKEITSNLSLVQLENKLRNEVDTLNKEKYDRLKCLKRMRAEEQELCEQLVLPQHELNFVGCPTKDQLRELEQNVKFLKNERKNRVVIFEKLKNAIIALWKEMDIEPEDELEKNLFESVNSGIFNLSSQNLDALKDLNSRLEAEHSTLLQEIDDKRKQFKLLHGRLQMQLQETERANILELPVGNTKKTLKILNEKINSLHELKRQHMQKFIESVRIELSLLWDKCFFGVDQRSTFQPFYSDVFTEESLAEHEHHFNSVKSYYDENKELFKLVLKRETLWEEKLKFENRPEDTIRFKNRGGTLLKELKTRNLIEKQLPKLEKQVMNKIKSWEKENESIFMFKDMRYREYIDSLKQEYEVEQQIKKDEKQRAKQEELSLDRAYGTQNSAKRKNCGTPTKGSKFFKFDSTHTMMRSPHATHTMMRSPLHTMLKSPLTKKVNPKKVGKMDRSNLSKFAHSSLSIPRSPNTIGKNENRPPGKINRKIPKLQTEARKKNIKRRSLRIGNNRILKEKNNIEDSIENANNVEICSMVMVKPDTNLSLMSYNEFSNAVAETPFSRSSFLCKPGDPLHMLHTIDASPDNPSEI